MSYIAFMEHNCIIIFHDVKSMIQIHLQSDTGTLSFILTGFFHFKKTDNFQNCYL